MPARLTLHPPGRPARVLVVHDGDTALIGRDDDNQLVIDHPRVSRHHAALRWTGDGWRLEDLGSKNGTSVNGLASADRALSSGDWISVGGIMGRFDVVSDEDREALETSARERRRAATGHTGRLSGNLAPWDVLLRLLGSAMEMADAERAFVVIIGPDGRPRVEAARGFSPAAAREEFAGGVGVLQRVFEGGSSVVVANAQLDPALRAQPKVAAPGLGTIACVPLTHERQVIGALCLASRRAGSSFTELDLEIVEALAGQASVLLAGIRLDEHVRAMLRESGVAAPEVVGALDGSIGRLPRPAPPTDAGLGPARGKA